MLISQVSTTKWTFCGNQASHCKRCQAVAHLERTVRSRKEIVKPMHLLNLLPRCSTSVNAGEFCPILRSPHRPISRAHVHGVITEKSQHCRDIRGRLVVSASDSSTEAGVSFTAVEALPVREDGGGLIATPAVPGVYAFYDKEGELQYIGLSRKVSP